MTKQLYKLTENYRTLEGMLDKEEYNPDDIRDMLDNVKEQIEDKVENITKIVLSLLADAKAIKEEEDRLKARRDAVNSKATWLKGYMLAEMTRVGMEKVKKDLFTVSVQPSPPSAEIVDLETIPEIYTRTIIEPDKRMIIDHFKKTGEVVSGVDIITGKKHLVIR